MGSRITIDGSGVTHDVPTGFTLGLVAVALLVLALAWAPVALAADTSGIYADPAGYDGPTAIDTNGDGGLDAGGYGDELGGDPAGYSEHGIDENGDGGLDAGGYGDELGGDPAGR